MTMFLELEGIDGESSDKRHLKEIDVESFSWGASGGRLGFAEGGVKISAPAEVRDIEFLKAVDRSSPTLYMFLFKSTTIRTAVLTIRKPGKVPIPFLILRFKNLRIADLSTTGGSASGDVPVERLKLGFESVQIEYTPQKPDGTPDGGAVTASWNVAENQPSF